MLLYFTISLFFSKTKLIFVSLRIPSFLKSAFLIAYQISLHFLAPPNCFKNLVNKFIMITNGFASYISFVFFAFGMFAKVLYVKPPDIPADYFPSAVAENILSFAILLALEVFIYRS